MEGTGQFTTFIQLVSLVSKPEQEEEEKGPGFSHSHVCLIVVEFHRLHIYILPYAYDVNIDTRHYTVRRFIIAVYGIQRNYCTHPAAEAIK